MDLHGDSGHTTLTDCWREGQRAVRRDLRLGGEERIVVVGDNEIQELSRLVRRTWAEVGRPSCNTLRIGIIAAMTVTTFSLSRHIVHALHRDGYRLNTGVILSAICTPAAAL